MRLPRVRPGITALVYAGVASTDGLPASGRAAPGMTHGEWRRRRPPQRCGPGSPEVAARAGDGRTDGGASATGHLTAQRCAFRSHRPWGVGPPRAMCIEVAVECAGG